MKTKVDSPFGPNDRRSRVTVIRTQSDYTKARRRITYGQYLILDIKNPGMSLLFNDAVKDGMAQIVTKTKTRK